MSTVVLGAMIAGTAAAVGLLIGSALVEAIWRAGASAIERIPPVTRAQALACLRLLPMISAALSCAVTLLAFANLEPAPSGETPGVVLTLLTVAVSLTVARGLWRAADGWHHTARCVRAWTPGELLSLARLPIVAIDAAFPVVAVVGIWRPRLYIARQVLRSCERAEIDAMIAHEAAHVAARDNFMRLLFLCAPAVRIASRAVGEIEAAWAKASEEAADDVAREDEATSLALASALAKVARLAAGSHAPLDHASAISSGSGVEHRVRRLLQRPPARRRRPLMPLLSAALCVVTAVATLPVVQRHVHQAAELCIRHLP